jgi:hypothetical protein
VDDEADSVRVVLEGLHYVGYQEGLWRFDDERPSRASEPMELGDDAEPVASG